MPSAAEILASPALLAQCQWRGIQSIPEGPFGIDEVLAASEGFPAFPFTGTIKEEGATMHGYFLRSECRYGPLGPGSAVHVFFLALLFPGPPADLIGLVECRGGYILGEADSLYFECAIWVPRE